MALSVVMVTAALGDGDDQQEARGMPKNGVAYAQVFRDGVQFATISEPEIRGE